MSSFYGNIKNSNRISLIFDKIYANRTEMETECAGEWLNVKNIDGVTSYTLMESQNIDLTIGFISTATCRGYNKTVTELLFTGSELYAGGIGLI